MKVPNLEEMVQAVEDNSMVVTRYNTWLHKFHAALAEKGHRRPIWATHAKDKLEQVMGRDNPLTKVRADLMWARLMDRYKHDEMTQGYRGQLLSVSGLLAAIRSEMADPLIGAGEVSGEADYLIRAESSRLDAISEHAL